VQIPLALNRHVMPVKAGIHAFLAAIASKTWMAGTSPAMTGGVASDYET
jgi:hypothetical protein